LAFEDVKT